MAHLDPVLVKGKFPTEDIGISQKTKWLPAALCGEPELIGQMEIWNSFKKWMRGGEIAVFHEFHKPPYGGGNQFLLALIDELRRQGIDISANRVGSNTRVLLLNSFNFNFDKVRKYKRSNIRIVHRVDGPVSVYRGLPTPAIDKEIADWNREMADATILQSRYSKEMHEKIGIQFRDPRIIPNAVNSQYFHPSADRPKRVKTRIAGTSWSTNPKKGLALYSWLDQNLDFDRYELAFMGRIDGDFKNVKVLPASGSAEVGEFLRQQDIYFMPSEHECCSNALLEALSTGLPAVYLKSGSSPELVGEAGEPYLERDQILPLFDRLAENLPAYRAKIRVRGISEVAQMYLGALRGQSQIGV